MKLIKNKYNHYFYLHTWVVLTRGPLRSTIVDYDRNIIELIPNELYDLLMKSNGKKIKFFFSNVESNADQVICEDYFSFLLEKEFIFLSETQDKELEIELETDYDSPQPVNNAIIDYNNSSKYEMNEVIQQLNNLGCQSLHLRFFDCLDNEKLISFIEHTNNTTIRDLTLLIKYNHKEDTKSLLELLSNSYMRISEIVIHSYPENKDPEVLNGKNILYTKNEINSCNQCGIINPMQFDISKRTFSLGENHNTCLYKKISVDAAGNIKNCPSMTETFGHIKTSSLEETIQKTNFTKIWDIKKEQIEICNICEFRKVCTDCRAYKNGNSNKFSKPAKCSYDPFTAVWKKLK